MTVSHLQAYLQDCAHFENPLLVAGHPAPDTDAAVSALFEAWRLTLSGIPAVPLLQGTLSRETAWLLDGISFPDRPKDSAGWVLTDHHDVAAYEGNVVAIVDHHPVAASENLAEIDACIHPVGAATTLVAQRIREDGVSLDAACARMLLGAVLLDTEGLSPYKAKAEDVAVAAWLSALCGEDVTAFYNELKNQLLSEDDVAVLYDRDFRTYAAPDGTPLMGFAILKVRKDCPPGLAAVRRRLAQDAATYAVAVAKIALYAPDDSREEIYLAAGTATDAVLELVLTHSGPAARRTAPDAVFLPAECHHWGRKRYAVKLIEILQKKA